MTKNCGCNEDNNHDCQCGCDEHEGHDHECGCGCGGHDDVQTIHLTLDDGTEMDCIVVGTFEINETSYIALVEEDDDQVMIYKYEEAEEGFIDLINIDSDEEFDLASQAFFELFVEE